MELPLIKKTFLIKKLESLISEGQNQSQHLQQLATSLITLTQYVPTCTVLALPRRGLLSKPQLRAPVRDQGRQLKPDHDCPPASMLADAKSSAPPELRSEVLQAVHPLHAKSPLQCMNTLLMLKT